MPPWWTDLLRRNGSPDKQKYLRNAKRQPVINLSWDLEGLHSLGQFGPPQGCVQWLASETS